MLQKNIKIELLTQLGLNNLEAEVYIHLLLNNPMTAYKVGKDLNKPTANVYKAIESLSKKGAVIIESNKNKQCKAVSPNEFISHYEKDLLKKTETIKELLNSIDKQNYDEKTYTIESVPLIFESFESMMKRCKVIAVIDAFPKALLRVIKPIERAIERGIEVFIQAYQPIDIKGADIAYTCIGDEVLEFWKSQQLNLIIDGEEHLITLMNNELSEVKQATWSNNYYMSCILHAGRMREQIVIKIMSKVNSENFESEVKRILENQKFFFNSNVPGFNKLFKTK